MKRLDYLQMFADAPADSLPSVNTNTNMNTVAQDGAPNGELNPTIKEKYNKQLLENARADLYFTNFAQKTSLPKGNGHTVEWRQWDTFNPRVKPLTEGVTPEGDKMGIRKITGEISQYGRYATITDKLEFEAFDPIIMGATEEFGASAAEVTDILARNIMIQTTNIQFAPKSDGTVVANASQMDTTCQLTLPLVNKAVTILKKNKTPKINGDYVAIIHPSVAMDLRNAEGWEEVHKYCRPEEIYNGEIGRLHGCRFIESLNAKVYNAGSAVGSVTAPASASLYSCLFFGKDAYGIIDPEGMGLEMIVKGKGSAGTADPLNQRSTVGYKLSTGGTILHPERIVNVICASSFGADDKDVVVEN